MIELFFATTPNVYKVSIALEEMGIAYRCTPLDILGGEQLKPAFLAINPNHRVPAIIDHAPADGGPPLPLFESGAILIYLADRSESFLSREARARAVAIQWVMWQMAGQGPMLGQAGHFRNYAPEKIAYGIDRYTREASRLYGVLERRLGEAPFIAGEDYSIADMACWPWMLFHEHHGVVLEDYPAVERWFRMVGERPAVARALGDFQVPKPAPIGEEAARILFGNAPKG